jgi:hypothetical protein
VQLKSKKSGWDKRQATLILTVFADGIGRVKPVLIFHGKLDSNRTRDREKTRYHPGVEVILNKEAYNNEEVMAWWLETQLFPQTTMGSTDS